MVSYRERTEGVITNTKLEDFIFCQYLYKLKWIDGLETGEDIDGEEEDPDWAIIGTAFDVYMQGVRLYNEQYAEVSKRTGTTGKIELTIAQGKLVRRMAMEMNRQQFYNPTGQKQFNVQYQYNEHIRLSGTLDEFQRDTEAIIDDKTSANIRKFRDHQDKYRRQLAFYQFLIYMVYKILCSGMIRMLTKEKVSKAFFFYADKKTLQTEWQRMNEALEELTECIKSGQFLPQPRSKCETCPAYASCPHAIQTEFYLL